MNKVAEIISNVFGPIPMILLVGLVGIFISPLSGEERMFWLLLFLAMVIIVGIVLMWFVRMGFVFDAKLTKGKDLHKDRIGALLATDVLLFIAVLVAGMLGRPVPLWNILLGTIITMSVATAVTVFYKVSFHMIGVTSFVTVLVLYWGVVVSPVILLIPLVAWARRTLNRHTIWQIILGTFIAATSYSGAFLLAR